eukprot:541740-Hanusia_phi.AAC.1
MEPSGSLQHEFGSLDRLVLHYRLFLPRCTSRTRNLSTVMPPARLPEPLPTFLPPSHGADSLNDRTKSLRMNSYVALRTRNVFTSQFCFASETTLQSLPVYSGCRTIVLTLAGLSSKTLSPVTVECSDLPTATCYRTRFTVVHRPHNNYLLFKYNICISVIAAQPVSWHQQTFITHAAVYNATPTSRETATMTDEFDLVTVPSASLKK